MSCFAMSAKEKWSLVIGQRMSKNNPERIENVALTISGFVLKLSVKAISGYLLFFLIVNWGGMIITH